MRIRVGMCVCGGRDGPECARMFFFFLKVGVFATRSTAFLFPVSQYIDTVVSVMIITITTDRIYVSCFPIDKYTVVSLSPRSALGRSASLRSLALRSASGRVFLNRLNSVRRVDISLNHSLNNDILLAQYFSTPEKWRT